MLITMKNNVELVDKNKLEEDKKGEFNKKLEMLKQKANEMRLCDKKALDLRLELRGLANDFVTTYKNYKPELGKAVSWIGDVYRRDELASILEGSITKDNWGLNSLDSELEKVPTRMSWGVEKPESFSDDRITNLVSVLNSYDNYIDTFESIELGDNENCLNTDCYLISYDFHNLLINGFRLQRNRVISKKEQGIYVVVFKHVKIDNKNTLIYKYIKYPYIFYDCLYHYFIEESGSLVIHNDTSVGTDYLFVMDKIFGGNNLMDTVKKITNKFLLNNSSKGYGIFPRNIIDLSKKLLQGSPMFLNSNDMCKFIKLVSDRNIYKNIEEIIELYGLYEDDSKNKGLEILSRSLKGPKFENYNFLGRMVFVTHDLDSLIKDIRVNYDGGVNQGPQPWRGQSDSLSHTINSIDNDFRRSINRHNQYHVNMGNIPRNSLIGRSKFSYQNIHLNIGNVRWYSTKRDLDNSKNIRKQRVISNTPVKLYKQPVKKDNTTIYAQLGEYLKDLPTNNDTQLQLETSLWDHAYIDLNTKLEARKDNSRKGPVVNYNLISGDLVKLLVDEKEKLLDYINRTRSISFKKEPSRIEEKIQYLMSMLFEKLDDDYIISVIYGRFFKIANKNEELITSYTSLDIFVDIANDLIGQYYYILFQQYKEEKKNDYTFLDWKEENIHLVSRFDSQSIKGEIGGRIISWLKSLDLVWFKLIIKGKKEKVNIILPTERVLKVLGDENKIKPLPRKLPMIVKPNNYSRVSKDNGTIREILGGYLLNGVKYTDKLMIEKWMFGKSTLINDDNLMYDLVNKISSVGYKVNKDVFDFISKYGLKYNLIINSDSNHPLMKKSKLTKIEHVELASYLSKIELQENIWGVAELYSNVHEFFIPVRVDFSGRLYCICEYLNYQSTELAKSLLLFSKSEKMYKSNKIAISYLKAYGANCFGNKLDKASWNDRAKWVDDNLDNIINFENGNLIKKAEKKLLFIAFCFEYNRYLDSLNNEKDYFETYLPIQLDATCNGYQHLSLLSLDLDLAKELNLTKSCWDDAPKDFYTLIGTRLVNYFQDKYMDSKIDQEQKERCYRLSNLTIARKIIKRGIMTIPYNVSHYKIVKYLQENFIDIEDETNYDKDRWVYFKEDISVKLKWSDFPILASGLQKVLTDNRYKLTKLLKYLNEAAKICTKLGLYIPWKSPSSGIHVNQSYLATKETRLKVFAYTKKTFTMKIADKDTYVDKGMKEGLQLIHNYNKSKQMRAFMPNLIHSLDADALALLSYYYFTDKSSDVKNIYTIHDCFAVTANNVENISSFLKVVYQKIYIEKVYLRQLHDAMIGHIKLHYGDNSINDDLYIETDNFKGQFPSINEIIPKNASTKGLVVDSSYLTN